MSPNTLSKKPVEPESGPSQPVSPDVLALLVALDRLLSVGSYYTPSHDRYKQVAREAERAVLKVMGPSPALQIEVSNDGFYILDQEIAADTREGRRLYELFNPLNIALIELLAEVTAHDLHDALTVFIKLKNQLTGSQTYDEIHIEGLPETVKTTDRSLYVRTKNRATGPAGTRPTNATQDYQLIPDSQLVGTPEGQSLERQFLAIISGIMKGSDPTRLKEVSSPGEKELLVAEWIPDMAILSIKDILNSLAETNSDPMMFESLISHAQSALEMTGDPELVELIFARLRKDTSIAKKTKPLLATRPKPKKKPTTYMMTIEQMREIMYSLENRTVPYDDLLGPSSADCLGICLQVLAVAPTEQLSDGIALTINRILSAPELSDEDLHVLSGSLASMLNAHDESMAEQLLPMIFTPLHRYHPQIVGRMWLAVWKSLTTDRARLIAWPYTVNDLLLGTPWEDPTQKLALYELVSRVDVGAGVALLEKLETMEALNEDKTATDIFHAPAPLLYPVHKVLLKSLAAAEHGRLLHERLSHQRSHLLSDLMVKIMGRYSNANKQIYQAILEQGVTERVTPVMRDAATRFLCTAVMSAEPEERQEFWVLDTINWLGRLDMNRAAAVLTEIVKEKRFFVWPVWPGDCRKVAKRALDQHEPGQHPADRDEETTAEDKR